MNMAPKMLLKCKVSGMVENKTTKLFLTSFLEMQDIYKFFWGKDYNKEDLAKDLKATKNNLMTMISTIAVKSMDIGILKDRWVCKLLSM